MKDALDETLLITDRQDQKRDGRCFLRVLM